MRIFAYNNKRESVSERERNMYKFYLYFAFLCQLFVVVVSLSCLVVFVVLSLFLLSVSPLVAVVVNYVSITFPLGYV